ncbi:unnamed protein product [Lymnaea stagnalis]|uniref:Uncharacterized protein n=1 Tax=Lymnaea stagnalis TaxID=6523 RepID=A0AAV2HE06_LYMST
MAEIPLPEPVNIADCPEHACVYEASTMDGRVNFADCFGVGYGTQSASDYNYYGAVNRMTITTSNCCDVLTDAVSKANGTYPETMVHSTSQVVCMGSDDSSCGGDFGTPIYCKSFDTNEYVLVAALTSAPCTSGDPILANDLTGGAFGAYLNQ